MSYRAPRREEYEVETPFYLCCFDCMTITKFEKGQKIKKKDLSTSGGWRYLPCPKCSHWHNSVNVDLSRPAFIISFPYAFMKEE